MCCRSEDVQDIFSIQTKHSPNVLMSSLSMKSHNLSMTSCTCFMHFPWNHKKTSPKNVFFEWFHPNGSLGLLSVNQSGKPDSYRWPSHLHFRHRNPQCRVCLCAETGSCCSDHGRGYTPLSYSGSTPYTSSLSLSQRKEEERVRPQNDQQQYRPELHF